MSVVVSEVEAVLFRVRYVPTAEIARDRLREIIREDREACGDGRWVKMPRAISFGLSGAFPTPYMYKERDYYRWEPRR